jgi:hypothetical protein
LNWKLTAGRLRGAVRDYPRMRRRLAAVPAGPPLFLTGTHRSGTTWLARMLGASGIWYAHEPFNPNKGRWPEAFTYRRPGTEDAAVDALMGEVLNGGFRAALNLPNADKAWMPLRWMPPKVSRRLVKDPLACLLAPYLTQRFSLQTLVVFRHPAGFSASVARLGWPRAEFLQRFLADAALMSDHLEPHRALIERHANEDTLASAAVLHGVLNKVLWTSVQAGMGRALLFEDLCADPIEGCRRLFEELGLPYDEGVRAEHEALCLGRERAVGEYRTHEVARNSNAMANSWRKELAPAARRELRAIWKEFGIPLYQQDGDWEDAGETAVAAR